MAAWTMEGNMSGKVRDHLVGGVMLQPEFTWLTNAVTPNGGVETGGGCSSGVSSLPLSVPLSILLPLGRGWSGAGGAQYSAESTGGTKQSPAPGTVCQLSG